MEKTTQKVKGFKGFDKDLSCRGYKYELGREYEIEGDLEICHNGFHFCENPFDVFDFYQPKIGARFCIVEATGKIVSKGNKSASNKIRLVKEISLKELYEEGFALLNANTSGDEAHANTSGDEAISSALGIKGKAKAEKGWITIVDWREDDNYNWHIHAIKSTKVGGRINKVKIEPDTWYWFEDGQLKSEK